MRKVSYEVCRKFVLIIYYGTNKMIDKVVFRCFSFTISTVKWRTGTHTYDRSVFMYFKVSLYLGFDHWTIDS